MAKHDPRIDDYVASGRDFARPILEHLRKIVHRGYPGVEETIKWGMPFFVYKGNLCHMAAFKNHCAFGFWKGTLLAGKHGALATGEASAMGQFGRITALSDLPGEKTLLKYVKDAAALNEQGVKAPSKAKPAGERTLDVPDYFMKALHTNKQARATFDAFSFSNRNEYVEWVTEAKTEATRSRRLETAIGWMAEGKIRNWKYVKKDA